LTKNNNRVCKYYCSEHLIINTNDCDELADKIINAGSIFLGAYTPESAGDYAPEQITPCLQWLRQKLHGVSLEPFEIHHMQKISKEGIKNLDHLLNHAKRSNLKARCGGEDSIRFWN